MCIKLSDDVQKFVPLITKFNLVFVIFYYFFMLIFLL